jgi:hypothetical protein
LACIWSGAAVDNLASLASQPPLHFQPVSSQSLSESPQYALGAASRDLEHQARRVIACCRRMACLPVAQRFDCSGQLATSRSRSEFTSNGSISFGQLVQQQPTGRLDALPLSNSLRSFYRFNCLQWKKIGPSLVSFCHLTLLASSRRDHVVLPIAPRELEK